MILAYGASRSLSDFIDSRYSGLSPDVRRVMTLFDPLSQVTSAEVLLDKHTSEETPLLRLFKPLLRQVFGDDLGVGVRERRVVFMARGEPVEAIDLPDGFRSSIAWLADLCAAWCEKFPKRAAKGVPADIEALVLIDEIDLHLHPSLQRTLVPRLRAALPQVQWVVTTHSPLVLSSFDTAEIVALDRDEPGGVRFLDRQILGFTTDQIYGWLMGTTPTSAAMEQELARNGDLGQHSEEELVELLIDVARGQCRRGQGASPSTPRAAQETRTMRAVRRASVVTPTLAPPGQGGKKAARNLSDRSSDPTKELSFPPHWNEVDVRGCPLRIAREGVRVLRLLPSPQ